MMALCALHDWVLGATILGLNKKRPRNVVLGGGIVGMVYHPQNNYGSTWKWMYWWKTSFLLGWHLFRYYVSFREGKFSPWHRVLGHATATRRTARDKGPKAKDHKDKTTETPRNTPRRHERQQQHIKASTKKDNVPIPKRRRTGKRRGITKAKNQKGSTTQRENNSPCIRPDLQVLCVHWSGEPSCVYLARLCLFAVLCFFPSPLPLLFFLSALFLCCALLGPASFSCLLCSFLCASALLSSVLFFRSALLPLPFFSALLPRMSFVGVLFWSFVRSVGVRHLRLVDALAAPHWWMRGRSQPINSEIRLHLVPLFGLGSRPPEGDGLVNL